MTYGRFLNRRLTQSALLVQNERYQDPVMIERLVRAVRRGVSLQLVAHAVHRMDAKEITTDTGGLRMLDDLGVQVRRLKHQRLHGNMLLADGARAMIGSLNFSPSSLDRRRELAIETDDSAVIKALQLASLHDWSHSRPIDLSEEGMREELQRHGRGDDAGRGQVGARRGAAGLGAVGHDHDAPAQLAHERREGDGAGQRGRRAALDPRRPRLGRVALPDGCALALVE